MSDTIDDPIVEINAETLQNTQLEHERQAIILGLKIITGTSRQLLLDIDTADGDLKYNRGIELFRTMYEIVDINTWISKSGNKHILIDLVEKLKPLEIIGWQLALGSDPSRERWNILKYMCGFKEFNKLFKPTL